MQALQLFALLPFLAICAPPEEPALTTAALEAEDAACSPTATEAECQVSFRQLRGERTISRHESTVASGRTQQTALSLTSTVTEDYNYKEAFTYSMKEFAPGASLMNKYTETPDGAKWEFRSVVISLDAQPQMFETVDEKKPLGLRIGVSSTLAGLLNAKCSVRVSRLEEFLPGTMTAGEPSESQMPYFRMAPPSCFGKQACYARKPAGGFAKTNKKSTGLPARNIVAYNLTGILDAKHTSVQVFVTPDDVDVDGLWSTAEFKVQSWRFFNLADSFDEDPSSEEGFDEDDDW